MNLCSLECNFVSYMKFNVQRLNDVTSLTSLTFSTRRKHYLFVIYQMLVFHLKLSNLYYCLINDLLTKVDLSHFHGTELCDKTHKSLLEKYHSRQTIYLNHTFLELHSYLTQVSLFVSTLHKSFATIALFWSQ